MKKSSETESQPKKEFLNLTFHASLVTAYERDGEESKKKLIAKFAENGVIVNEGDIRPFYKKYTGIFAGHYEDIAGYIIKTPAGVIVSYRGTVTNYDRYRDAQYSQSQMEFGRPTNDTPEVQMVHAGFKLDYESSKESRDQIFKDMGISDNDPFIFTGHSLGGAVSQIAAADYAAQSDRHRDKIQAVYTFGTPRAFVTKAIDFYDNTLLLGNKTLHIMAAGDPIIGVPPASYGFSHTGHYAMMKTISSFGLSNHFIRSYEEIVSKSNHIELRQGDSIKETRKKINNEEKINISQYIWKNIYDLMSLLSPTRAIEYWYQCAVNTTKGIFLDKQEIDPKLELSKDTSSFKERYKETILDRNREEQAQATKQAQATEQSPEEDNSSTFKPGQS